VKWPRPSVCLCVINVCLPIASFPYYCMHVTWGIVAGANGPLAVHYWADLQSVQGFRCYDNIHVCKVITLYAAKAYSAEREMYSLYGWFNLTVIFIMNLCEFNMPTFKHLYLKSTFSTDKDTSSSVSRLSNDYF